MKIKSRYMGTLERTQNLSLTPCARPKGGKKTRNAPQNSTKWTYFGARDALRHSLPTPQLGHLGGTSA